MLYSLPFCPMLTLYCIRYPLQLCIHTKLSLYLYSTVYTLFCYIVLVSVCMLYYLRPYSYTCLIRSIVSLSYPQYIDLFYQSISWYMLSILFYELLFLHICSLILLLNKFSIMPYFLFLHKCSVMILIKRYTHSIHNSLLYSYFITLYKNNKHI